MNRFFIIFLFLTMLVANQANAALQTFVSIPPQKWLVDRIGAELTTTTVLVGDGQDPHSFEPTPQVVSRLASTTLWFTMDMEFEEHLISKIRQAAPKLQIVDITDGITKRRMAGGKGEHHHDEHAHNQQEHDVKHEKAHPHSGHEGGYDPHVWLSPENLIIMAKAVEQALVDVDPVNSGTYMRNRKQVEEELTKLDQVLGRMLAPHKGASFYVFHPSFGYFANAYGLKQHAVEVEGKEPTPRQLSQLIPRAKTEGVKVIFVQPQFDSRSAQVIAEAIHGEVVPLDPLAEDVPSNLRLIGERINSALTP